MSKQAVFGSRKALSAKLATASGLLPNVESVLNRPTASLQLQNPRAAEKNTNIRSDQDLQQSILLSSSKMLRSPGSQISKRQTADAIRNSLLLPSVSAFNDLFGSAKQASIKTLARPNDNADDAQKQHRSQQSSSSWERDNGEAQRPAPVKKQPAAAPPAKPLDAAGAKARLREEPLRARNESEHSHSDFAASGAETDPAAAGAETARALSNENARGSKPDEVLRISPEVNAHCLQYKAFYREVLRNPFNQEPSKLLENWVKSRTKSMYLATQ